MDGHTTYFSRTCSVSSIVSPYDQLYSAPKSTPKIGRNASQELNYLATVIGRPSDAPSSSPVSSPERNSKTLWSYPAEFVSSPWCPLLYLKQYLGKLRAQACQGESLNLSCQQARRRFSFEDELFNYGESGYIHERGCHCPSLDDDSTMVDLTSRAQSMCSETDTVLEDTTLNGRTLSYYTAHKASLSCDYPELYPSDPGSPRHTISSTSQSPPPNYVARLPLKPYLEARWSYGLLGSPPVATRSRQISLPIIHLPSLDPTTNPQIPTIASSRAQSWHASPIYSPSRKPPQPPQDIEKSMFEDYDEDSAEEKKLSNRFRHLMRRLHCG